MTPSDLDNGSKSEISRRALGCEGGLGGLGRSAKKASVHVSGHSMGPAGKRARGAMKCANRSAQCFHKRAGA